MSQKSNQAILAGMGHMGAEIVTGAASGTAGPWVALQCTQATVLSALTMAGSTGTFTGKTLPAQFILYGPISAFTLTSGEVVAYKGNIN